MQSGHKLQFHCPICENPLTFSVLDASHFSGYVVCEGCGKKYLFDDETLLRHLKQFEALCRQIYASEEILGKAAIAIDIGNNHVKLPFNLLLTRLSSVIELNMQGRKVTISFRVEPLKDVPQASFAENLS